MKNDFFNDNFLNFVDSVESGLSDNVHCSLKLKPIETLNHALPELYKNYCGLNDNRDADDCRDFLNNITKKYNSCLKKLILNSLFLLLAGLIIYGA